MPVQLSVLICTLESRLAFFQRIKDELLHQRERFGLLNKVEILWEKDNGQSSVGEKRNNLLQASSGEYVCFVDDDDIVNPNYLQLISEALKSKPDCVNLTGQITTDGRDPKTFIHSIKYKDYSEKDGVYYRPPNHLNAIKSEVAKQFDFPEKNFGEDTEWAMKICRSGILKKEAEINQTLYYYLYRTKK